METINLLFENLSLLLHNVKDQGVHEELAFSSVAKPILAGLSKSNERSKDLIEQKVRPA